MAQQTMVIFEDDIDGSEAEGTVTFGINGVQYELDLSKKNADKLAQVFEPYIGVGRKISARTPRRSTATTTKRHDQSAVRAWARGQGMKVSDRGRIPADVLSQYEAAH